MKTFNFAQHLLVWFDEHGRKDLPWQLDASPYHVWLSEIMLQQTQVTTVIPYYQKFTQRFPDISTLAQASLDEVLSYWAGLGYYARARNLHKAAQQVLTQYQGKLPDTFDELLALPGIGRSTAGAILALAFHRQYSILDGNVKRVLARFYAIEQWPGEKQTEHLLWQHAEQLLPKQRIANYIQAQMDLGATLCTRSKPACERCPLQLKCQAYQLDKVTDYPRPKPNKKKIPLRQTCWLVLMDKSTQKLMMQQRPQSGIWGGLWSFPEFEQTVEIESHCQQLDMIALQVFAKPSFIHIFTHFKLNIMPYLVICESASIAEKDQDNWYKIDDIFELALPAPVRSFLNSIK